MWVNDEEDYKKYFFEFLITVDEITKDVSLTVTDFSDDDEMEESKMLWTNLVGDLKQVLGLYNFLNFRFQLSRKFSGALYQI